MNSKQRRRTNNKRNRNDRSGFTREPVITRPPTLVSGAGHDALGGRWPATAAVGEVGDVYLIHPLTLHSATMSCVPRAKSIFNVPFPFLETGVASKQGALSTVVLTIEEARHAARARGLSTSRTTRHHTHHARKRTADRLACR